MSAICLREHPRELAESSFLAAFGEIQVCIYRSKWKLCLKSILEAVARIIINKNISVTFDYALSFEHAPYDK